MLRDCIRILFSIALFSAIFTLSSCTGDDDVKKTMPVDKNKRKESLEKANRYIFLKEKEDIDDYIARHGLNVVETGSGLCYSVIKNGSGTPIKRGEVVAMEYEVRLLNGDYIYGSKEDGPKAFVVGRGGVESGLEEAVLNLHRGDISVIILPSHLAHGLIGDGNKITTKTPIVYKVKIIDNK